MAKAVKSATKLQEFYVVIEKDEDGYYVADVPELPGCHTQAKSLDELLPRIKEAIELYLEVRPLTKQSTEFIGIQRVTIKASKPVR
ncbi:type II toxin-antitoxin system HicB family antitoxin [Candidatus Acetothermia bacterium]|nr:type II toxin-antitoxin system HicB family antitoxin [Candidatus Acetothermia bacterium]